MEHTITVKIESIFGHKEEFKTSAILGAFLDENPATKGNISQFLLGQVNKKEMTKLLSGIINCLYIAEEGSPIVDAMVLTALKAACEKYHENHDEKVEEMPLWMQAMLKNLSN